MLAIGDELELNVETVVYRGDGLARHDGMVVFIPGVAPGERVRVRLVRLHARFANARIVEILDAAPDRIAPCCRLPDGTRVPGCVYDHLAYPAEVALKQRQLREFLARLPGVGDKAFGDPLPSPRPLLYRNKIVLHAQCGAGRYGLPADRTVLGYFGEDNRTVIDLPACPLARPEINEALTAWRDGEAFRRLRDNDILTFRWTAADGAHAWLGDRTPATWLTEQSPVGPLHVPAGCFYQINPDVADAVVRQVSAWAVADNVAGGAVLDLYCGVGVFALACAQAGARQVVGVESGRLAVEAARDNARTLGVVADFRCQPAAEAARQGFAGLDAGALTVIMDPPRAGLEPEVTAALAATRPRRLIYVSCDPATLARDLRVLMPAGYRLRAAHLFDMFPRTASFETVAWLERC